VPDPHRTFCVSPSSPQRNRPVRTPASTDRVQLDEITFPLPSPLAKPSSPPPKKQPVFPLSRGSFFLFFWASDPALQEAPSRIGPHAASHRSAAPKEETHPPHSQGPKRWFPLHQTPFIDQLFFLFSSAPQTELYPPPLAPSLPPGRSSSTSSYQSAPAPLKR